MRAVIFLLFFAITIPTCVSGADNARDVARALESRYVPSAGYVGRMVTALLSTDRLPRAWWEEESGA